MSKNKVQDKLGNHPEAEDIKNICEVSPKSRMTKDICKPLKKYQKEKTNKPNKVDKA